MGIDQVLGILRCPVAGTQLYVAGHYLVSGSRVAYPIENGIVHLYGAAAKEIKAAKLPAEPTSIVGQPPFHTSLRISGLSENNKIGYAKLTFPATDGVQIIADATALPIVDGSIQEVVADHIFSAIPNTRKLVNEIGRILQNGGVLHSEHNFQRGYHDDTVHLYGYSPIALEAIVAAEMDILSNEVTPGGGAISSVAESLLRILNNLPIASADALKKVTLSEFLTEAGAERRQIGDIESGVSPYLDWALCTSFNIVAKKNSAGTPVERPVNFGYYRLKMQLTHRHHEVELYRQRAIDLNRSLLTLPPPPNLNDIISATSITLGMSDNEVIQREALLATWESTLTIMRNEWITRC